MHLYTSGRFEVDVNEWIESLSNRAGYFIVGYYERYFIDEQLKAMRGPFM